MFFKNFLKTNAFDQKIVTVTYNSPQSKYLRSYTLEDEILKELNNGHYDVLQINVKGDNFRLSNLHPKNQNAQVNVVGGENITFKDCQINYLTTNATDLVAIEKSTIQIANMFNAKDVHIEDIDTLMTFNCPKATSLIVRRANAQLGSDIPGLQKLDGGTVENFAAPVISSNVKNHIKEIGNSLIGPQVKTDWYNSLAIYNGTTGNFVIGYDNIPMSKTETSEKEIKLVKEKLIESASLFGSDEEKKGARILRGFVNAILEMENPENTRKSRQALLTAGI